MDEFLNNYLKIMEERIKMAMIEDHIIHGYMIYRCQHCGAVYYMHLEEGLEDPTYDAATGEHKPVPFMISCIACGWDCYHEPFPDSSLSYGKNYRSYNEMVNEPNETIYRNFFWNEPGSECGTAVLFEPDMQYGVDQNTRLLLEQGEAIVDGLKSAIESDVEQTVERIEKDWYDRLRDLISSTGCSPNREQRRHGMFGKRGYKRPKSNKKLYDYGRD